MREKLNYPPFCDIIIAVLSGKDENIVKLASNELYELLKKHFDTYAPMPAPINKINGEYRWRILVKECMDEKKNEILGNCINEFLTKKFDIRLGVDVNPNNMM